MPSAPAPVAAPRERGSVRVRGARTHNLRDVDVELPREALIVITGPSGSGKSSLAFDTIFAEGQRRYVESLSIGARQLIAQLPAPDVDLVEGLSPTLAIEQRAAVRNPRSTVGTTTEILDFLRLLYARVGEVVDPRTGAVVRRDSAETVVDAALALPPDTRFSVIAPVVRSGAGDHAELLDELRRRGFVRVAIDDEVRDLGEPIALDPGERHTIEVYVDRLKLKPDVAARLADSVETALGLASGRVRLLTVEGQVLDFSERFELSDGASLPELTPALFSFNSPEGACPRCDGLGSLRVVDPQRVVPDERQRLSEGAVRPWTRRGCAPLKRQLEALLEHLGVSPDERWCDLDAEARVAVLQGSGTADIPALGRPFEGVIPWIDRRLLELSQRAGADDEADEPTALEELQEFVVEQTCPECEGHRLRREARMVHVAGRPIHELTALPLVALSEHLDALRLPAGAQEIADAVLLKARERLRCLIDLGLGYLTLARATMTLSGGESQRVRLATQLGAALVGVTYVLDEPSIGLHPRDNGRLVATLQQLRDRGNTVIVVEHDAETMLAADHLVDMGPGAGVHGGRVVAAGTLAEVLADPRSPTGAWLAGRERIVVPSERRRPRGPSLVVEGARGHNLRDVSARFPLGLFTCVTGVSGSGKSSLVIDTLLPEVSHALHGAAARGLPHAAITGLQHLERVVHVDQAPIGRSPRSNPATYTGLMTDLRQLFAQLPEARARGYGPARFSFNVKGGRCEACQGEGVRRIEMHFLPDVFVTCPVCHGRRFERATLQVRLRGQSIADVLAMSVADACELFIAQPAIRQRLEMLRDVGLGYVSLGQSSLTLSGGEAQRIKLARELARRGAGPTLFVLDEPTTGLHFGDVAQLLRVLQRLVDEGHTVIVIEHDIDVIKAADHVIDMGPGGGDEGGVIVATGTPEQLARSAASPTAPYLREALARAQRGEAR
jgi:excinuclease ABC subunit A